MFARGGSSEEKLPARRMPVKITVGYKEYGRPCRNLRKIVTV